MIIDVHTHICPPEVIRNRTKYAVPEEKAFHLLYEDPKEELADAEGLIAAMDTDGVDMSVAFGFPWASEDTARRANDYVLEAQSKYPERIIGLACFDPLQPWAEREAVRCLDAGLKGLGELAVYTSNLDRNCLDRLGAMADICRERQAPLMIHVNEPIGHDYPGKAPMTVNEIYDLVRVCRDVPLILPHWGGGLLFYHLLKKEVPAALKDVYFDTAASPYLYRPDIYRVASEIVGPEKILLGTDYPLLPARKYFAEIEKAEVVPSARKLILGESAQRLFPKH